jgi:hypothetical protein
LNFLTLEEIYQEIIINGDCVKEVRLLLELRNWLNGVCDFDPRSGQASPLGNSTLTNKIVKQWSVNNEELLKDRLSRIIDHSKESVKVISKKPKQKVFRENKILPIYVVREVNSSSMLWLNQKSGRNIREKLAGKPYLKAVHRRMSVDTIENRLFKHFSLKLERYLIKRIDALGIGSDQSEYELLGSIKKWLKSGDSNEIHLWSNLPPNNTLLQDRNYRKIWDAWLWLQRLDEDLQNDQKRLLVDWQTTLFWTIYSKLKLLEQIRFVEHPILFEYDNFKIEPLIVTNGIIYSKKSLKQLQNINCFIESNKIVIETREIFISIKSKWNKQDQIISISINGESKNHKPSISEMKNISEQVVEILFNKSYATLEKEKKSVFITQNERLSDTVIDICNVRPDYINSTSARELPFRLLQQLWETKDHEIVALDLGDSDAIAFRPNTESISMVNIFSTNSVFRMSHIRQASMSFVKKLSEYFDRDKLFTYLVPDAVDDFSLAEIRSSINFYFNNAKPLPRSIASVFAWQTSEEFSSLNINAGDCILVIDSILDYLTVTPLIFREDKKKILEKKIPESQGYYLERYPSIILEENSLMPQLIESLDNDGCKYSEDITALFGFDGIIRESNKISFVDNEDQWYTQTNEFKVNRKSTISWKELESNFKGFAKKSIYVISIGEYLSKLKLSDFTDEVFIANMPVSLVQGGRTLNEWQLKAVNIPLWVDHLPELSIEIQKDGYYDLFTLVKDEVVKPIWGIEQKINIPDRFDIPKGEGKIFFPLFIGGEQGKPIEYQAVLKSRALPLKSNTQVKLNLSYTYGGKDTYNLSFSPTNPKTESFVGISAEWESIQYSVGKGIMDKKLIPEFPSRESWLDLRSYYNPLKPEKHKTDLIEWLTNGVQNMQNFTKQNQSGKPIFNVLISHLDNDNEEEIKNFNLNLRRWFEVSTRNLWSQGRSIDDDDFPVELKENIHKFINILLDLSGIQPDKISIEQHKSINGLNDIRNSALLLLSRFHSDLPEIVHAYLSELIRFELNKQSHSNKIISNYLQYAAMTIGSAKTKSQQNLMDLLGKYFINKGKIIKSQIFRTFSVAVWRNKNFIYQLKDEKLIYEFIAYITQTIRSSLSDHPELKDEQGKWNRYLGQLQDCYELLLALIRLRKIKSFQDELLLPDSSEAQHLAYLIRRSDALINKHNQTVRSRIQFDLQKPKSLYRMADLTYALNTYLTGDEGHKTISISGIIDNEDL